MAKLLLIAQKSYSVRDNRNIGDIVGVFEDGHVFSAHEQEVFNIVTVRGTKEEVQASFSRSTVRLDDGDTKAWRDSDGTIREIKETPRFSHNYEALSKTIRENIPRIPENQTAKVISTDRLEPLEADRLNITRSL